MTNFEIDISENLVSDSLVSLQIACQVDLEHFSGTISEDELEISPGAAVFVVVEDRLACGILTREARRRRENGLLKGGGTMEMFLYDCGMLDHYVCAISSYNWHSAVPGSGI